MYVRHRTESSIRNLIECTRNAARCNWRCALDILNRRAALKASALFGMGAMTGRSLIPAATAADGGASATPPAESGTRYGPQSATGNVAAVLDGDIDGFMWPYLQRRNEFGGAA